MILLRDEDWCNELYNSYSNSVEYLHLSPFSHVKGTKSTLYLTYPWPIKSVKSNFSQCHFIGFQHLPLLSDVS